MNLWGKKANLTEDPTCLNKCLLFQLKCFSYLRGYGLEKENYYLFTKD